MIIPLPTSINEWHREKHHFVTGQHTTPDTQDASGGTGNAYYLSHMVFKMESLLITHAYVNILHVTELKSQVCLLSQHLFYDTDLIPGRVSPNT